MAQAAGDGATEPTAQTDGRMRRRGMIAAAAALAAGVLASRAESVAAINGGTDGGALIIGANAAGATPPGTGTNTANTSGTLTELYATPPGGASAALAVRNNYTGSLDARADGIQAYAVGQNNAGLVGRNDALNGVGTVGVASNGTGVYGQSTGGSGIAATSSSGNGVFSTSTGGNGVYGASGSGNGVYGTSGSGIGVFGQAPQFGVVGSASNVGGYGIYGTATTDNSAGFAGGTSNPNAFAAVFGGRVVINGSLTVSGAKSAAVPHPDGSHRLVYCVEAPESWLEDFGEAKLVAGRAEVRLATDFAEVADTRDVHVFINEVGDGSNARVKAKGAGGFTVEADATLLAMRGKRMTDANGSFSYRVVARRKDIPANRLAKIELPNVRIEVPKAPAKADLPKPR